MKEYSISQVAEMLNVDRSTVWRWLKEERFERWRRKGFGDTSPIAISEESVQKVAEQLGVNVEANGHLR